MPQADALKGSSVLHNSAKKKKNKTQKEHDPRITFLVAFSQEIIQNKALNITTSGWQ